MTIKEALIDEGNDDELIDDIIEFMVDRVHNDESPVDVLRDFDITDDDCIKELIDLCND